MHACNYIQILYVLIKLPSGSNCVRVATEANHSHLKGPQTSLSGCSVFVLNTRDYENGAYI